MLKSEQLIKKIKKFEDSPQHLVDFYSKNEIRSFIVDYETSLKEKEFNTYRLDNKNAKNNDITSIPKKTLKDKVIKKLRSKVEPIINPEGSLDLEFDIAFHGNKKAYGIHTDSGYDENEFIYKQGIIPLKISPENKFTHTILLNQKCYHSSSFPLISDDEQAQKSVEGLDFSYIIPEAVYKKYWETSESRIKQMKGFSICNPFKWVMGDTIIWDRSHIHCSSDFAATGVEFKLGLMWISRIISV